MIIGDSRTHPLRWGCVGIAIGCSGIEAVEDVRGKKDLYGKPLKVTKKKAVADNIASAAQMLMGECDESVPMVVMRNASVEIKEVEGIPTISPEECLYFTIRSYDLLYITPIDIRHKKHSELRGGEMNERK